MGNARFSGHSGVKSAPGKSKLLDRPAFHIMLVALLGLVAYSNTFGVPFVFDDILLYNRRLGNISGIPSLFWDIRDYFGSRPLLLATISLNYYLGGLDTWGYHAVNLALHLANGALLYLLVTMTGRHLGYDEKNIRRAALFSAGLFVLHPMQTEAVTNIVGRSMLLATAFYLSGMMLFLKAVTAERRKGLFIAGLLATSLLGMASRENFVTFPMMLVLYDMFFVSRFSLRETAKHWKTHLLVLLSLGYLAYLVLNSTYNTGADYPGVGVHHKDYFFTQFSVHWTYLRLLVLPINQNVDYGYPIARTLFEFPTLFSFIGYIGLWAAGIGFARRKPILSFSVLWFLVALLPISFLVTFMDLRLDDVIFEHRLYLPGTAFFALAGVGMALALKKFRGERLRTAAVAVGVIVPLVLAIAAFNRNAVWQSGISLWEDAMMKSPQKPRPHYNLGNAYGRKGQFDMAIKEYRAAIGLKPDYVEAHNNLGNAYNELGQFERAFEEFQIAIELKPDHVKAHNNLGGYYKRMGQLDMAMEKFRTAIELQPGYATAHYNLGIVYEEKGLLEKAIEHYRTTIRLKPDNAEAHNNLGAVLGDRGRLGEAVEHFQTAIKLDPEHAAAHNNLGAAYQMMGLPDKAEEHFRQSWELTQGR